MSSVALGLHVIIMLLLLAYLYSIRVTLTRKYTMTDISVSSIELELTYLAKSLPAGIETVTPKRLKDVYVPDIEGVHPRLRIRRKGDKFEITKKIPISENDASAHTELTIPLDQQEFEALERTSNKLVEKDRYNISIEGHAAEVDVFTGDLEGLVVIDFEFDTEEQKSSFVAPDVCLADVTQEQFIAGGKLAGKNYADIQADLDRFAFKPIKLSV